MVRSANLARTKAGIPEYDERLDSHTYIETRKAVEREVAKFHYVLAGYSYNLLGIHSLRVMQRKNHLHFFFRKCEVSKAGPC